MLQKYHIYYISYKRFLLISWHTCSYFQISTGNYVIMHRRRASNKYTNTQIHVEQHLISISRYILVVRSCIFDVVSDPKYIWRVSYLLLFFNLFAWVICLIGGSILFICAFECKRFVVHSWRHKPHLRIQHKLKRSYLLWWPLVLREKPKVASS